MTADTFGKAADQTKGLPVDFRIIKTGVGNGGNDVPMMDKAGLKIAVMGPEGVSAELARVAKAVNLLATNRFVRFCSK
jgi:soluble P-type ATPase